MINEILLKKLNEAEKVSLEDLYSKSVTIKDLNFLQIRDYLIIDGSIVEEDLNDQIYTVYYRTGLFNLSRSITGVMLEKDKLTVAGTNEKIVEKIIAYLTLKKKKKSNRAFVKYFSLFIVLIVGTVGLFATFAVKPAIRVTSDYNAAVLQYNEVAKDYNKEVIKVSVDNIEGVPGEVDLLKEVNNDFFSVSLSILKRNSSSKIKKDINTINSMINTLNDGKIIISKIYNPSSQYIESLLKNIDEIDLIKSVTKYNDPNGLLGKNHGYNSCIYFTIDGLKIEGINSNDPIVLGTNGGGCIEVYSTVEDAMNRCEYLSQFDNTLLYSGSYAVVGTMVIRTSYVLSDHQQYTLTNYIVQQFTKI